LEDLGVDGRAMLKMNL